MSIFAVLSSLLLILAACGTSPQTQASKSPTVDSAVSGSGGNPTPGGSGSGSTGTGSGSGGAGSGSTGTGSGTGSGSGGSGSGTGSGSGGSGSGGGQVTFPLPEVLATSQESGTVQLVGFSPDSTGTFKKVGSGPIAAGEIVAADTKLGLVFTVSASGTNYVLHSMKWTGSVFVTAGDTPLPRKLHAILAHEDTQQLLLSIVNDEYCGYECDELYLFPYDSNGNVTARLTPIPQSFNDGHFSFTKFGADSRVFDIAGTDIGTCSGPDALIATVTAGSVSIPIKETSIASRRELPGMLCDSGGLSSLDLSRKQNNLVASYTWGYVNNEAVEELELQSYRMNADGTISFVSQTTAETAPMNWSSGYGAVVVDDSHSLAYVISSDGTADRLKWFSYDSTLAELGATAQNDMAWSGSVDITRDESYLVQVNSDGVQVYKATASGPQFVQLLPVTPSAFDEGVGWGGAKNKGVFVPR